MASTDDAVDLARPVWRRWWVRLSVAVSLAVWSACWAMQARFYADHPAPLGRTQHEIDRTLARALPVGTTLDSARAFLRANGLEASIIDSVQEQYRLVGSAFAIPGGVLMQTGTYNINYTAFCNVGAGVDLAFDAAHRLARRHVDIDYVCP